MREDIKNIYLSDIKKYSHIEGIDLDEPEDNRKFYVYEWFTKNNHKVFYVGKGTGKRYAHILKEIELYENNPKKYKGKNYKIIKDEYGVDYNIIMNELTESEALIMENYFIINYLKDRQPLLNQVVPEIDKETDEYWYNVHYKGNILDYFREDL